MTPSTITPPAQKTCPTCGRSSKKDRSSNQNRYMWSVVYQMIADEMGESTEYVHNLLKNSLLPRMFMRVGEEEREIEKSTTLLTTTEMEDYLTKVRQWAGSELNCYIPLPNESPL